MIDGARFARKLPMKNLINIYKNLIYTNEIDNRIRREAEYVENTLIKH